MSDTSDQAAPKCAGGKGALWALLGALLGAGLLWLLLGGGHGRGQVSFRRVRFINNSGLSVNGVSIKLNGTANANASITSAVASGSMAYKNANGTGYVQAVTTVSWDISYQDSTGTTQHATPANALTTTSGKFSQELILVFMPNAVVQYIEGHATLEDDALTSQP